MHTHIYIYRWIGAFSTTCDGGRRAADYGSGGESISIYI